MIRVSKIIVGLILCGVSVGCSTSDVKPYEPTTKKGRTLFLPSYTTAGPEQVYARTRWVHPPEVLPSRDSDGTDSSYDAPPLRPVYELSLKNANIDQTCKLLASMARYSSYTSPSLTDQKFSIQNLGTLDELSRIIEEKAQIKVVVDHENKEVRCLVRTALEPTLFSE
ncbi:MAG: hypothetical protein RL518_319 [Pseudomonadota bacterium]